MSEIASVVAYVLQLALGILVPHIIVRLDGARLDRRRWLRTWPPASHLCAIVVFGPIAVLVHFLRTRRSLGGLALGLIGTFVALLPGALVGWLLTAV